MPFTDKAHMTLLFGEKELRELTDRAVPRVGSIIDTVLNGAIDAAHGWVTVYLDESFDITAALLDPPAPLKQVEADIARYFLWKEPTEMISAKFNQAIEYLKLARIGTLGLGRNAAGVRPTRDEDAIFCAGGRVLTNDRLESYMNQQLPDDCAS